MCLYSVKIYFMSVCGMMPLRRTSIFYVHTELQGCVPSIPRALVKTVRIPPRDIFNCTHLKNINRRRKRWGADDGVVKYPFSSFPPLFSLWNPFRPHPSLFVQKERMYGTRLCFSVNTLGLHFVSPLKAKTEPALCSIPPFLSASILMCKESDLLHPMSG